MAYAASLCSPFSNFRFGMPKTGSIWDGDRFAEPRIACHGRRRHEDCSFETFAENRIDISVLPDLTDHDLEKLGVVLGDRRKMLRAIANLEAWKIAPRYDRCHSVSSPQSHIAR